MMVLMRFSTGPVKHCMVVIFTHNMWIFNLTFPGYYYWVFFNEESSFGTHVSELYLMNAQDQRTFPFLLHPTCREEPGAFGRGSGRDCPGSTPHLGSNMEEKD